MRSLMTMMLTAALLSPGTLLAQGPPPGFRGGMGMGPRMGRDAPQGATFSPQMLLNRAQQLDLSDAQTGQLEALAAEVRKAHDDAAAAARPHEQKLRELWQADKPDVDAIQTEMQALMAARHTAGLATASATARAKGLLTDAQRGRVEGWADGRRMQGRRDDRSGWDAGPRRGSGMGYRMRRF